MLALKINIKKYTNVQWCVETHRHFIFNILPLHCEAPSMSILLWEAMMMMAYLLARLRARAEIRKWPRGGESRSLVPASAARRPGVAPRMARTPTRTATHIQISYITVDLSKLTHTYEHCGPSLQANRWDISQK